MANALFAWGNLATPAAQVVSGWSAADVTARNVLTADLSQRWRAVATDAAACRLEISLDGSLGVELVGIASHNLFESSATWQVTASNDNFASTSADSGASNVWPAMATASRRGLRWVTWWKPSAPFTCSQLRVQINNTAAASGYVEVGRLLVMSKAWQPTVNLLAGSAIGWEGGPTVTEALNGAEWVDATRQPARVARVSLANMPEAEMLSRAFDLMRVASGAAREVLFAWDPADTEQLARRSWLGRLRALSPLEAPQAGTYATAYEVKELV